MDDVITRQEHEEFRRSMELANKAIEMENARQNKRLDILEENAKAQTSLTVNVERLATNMENMLKEQKAQGERLETLEERDGEMWRKVITYIATAIIGILVGFIFRQVGM